MGITKKDSEEFVWYDVCNDYSLDKRDRPDLSGYRHYRTKDGQYVYVHIEYDEIHYLFGKDGREGGYL